MEDWEDRQESNSVLLRSIVFKYINIFRSEKRQNDFRNLSITVPADAAVK